MEHRITSATRVHRVEVRESRSGVRSGETVASGGGDEVLTGHVSGGKRAHRSTGRVWGVRVGRSIAQAEELLDGEGVTRSIGQESTVHDDDSGQVGESRRGEMCPQSRDVRSRDTNVGSIDAASLSACAVV